MAKKIQKKRCFSWVEFWAFVLWMSCLDIMMTMASDLVLADKLNTPWQVRALVWGWFALGGISAWAAFYFDKKRKKKASAK